MAAGCCGDRQDSGRSRGVSQQRITGRATMNLKRFFSRSSADAELAQELEAHLQHEVDDNLARGMSWEEAQRQARIKLGSVRRVRETVWERNSFEWFETALRDLRYAV